MKPLPRWNALRAVKFGRYWVRLAQLHLRVAGYPLDAELTQAIVAMLDDIAARIEAK